MAQHKETIDKAREAQRLIEDGAAIGSALESVGLSHPAFHKWKKSAKKKIKAKRPPSIAFEIPEIKASKVAVIIVPLNELKEVMGSLWQ